MNINQCSPVWSFRPKDNFPLLSTRKIMISELMIVFFIYFCVDAYLDWKNKKIEGSLALNYNLYKWRDTFYRCFGDHVIGMGFALTFSPYVFEIILCIVHMLFFIWLTAG